MINVGKSELRRSYVDSLKNVSNSDLINLRVHTRSKRQIQGSGDRYRCVRLL